MSLEGCEKPGQKAGTLQFPASHCDGTGQLILPVLKVILRLVCQRHDLLRPPAEQHPLLCQNDAVLAPAEQLNPQFLLQLHQLSG